MKCFAMVIDLIIEARAGRNENSGRSWVRSPSWQTLSGYFPVLALKSPKKSLDPLEASQVLQIIPA